MKKLFITLIAAILALTATAAFAEEEITDFSGMTAAEWYTYEWQKDVSTIYADVTSYDYDYVRGTLIPLHEKGFAECVSNASGLSEEEKLALVQELHDARLNTPIISDPEAARVYLWPEGNMPCATEYTENPGFFFGNEVGFKPYMIECLVDEGVEVKGAILICAGGGFNCRCNVEEGIDVATAFNALGYQCFIVNYRIKPYTTDEGALDLTRAIRIVRADAEKYGIDPDNIAAAGFSAGGMVIMKAANSYFGDINASALVEGYTPDDIDAVSADINALLCIYSYLRGEDGPATEFENPAFPATFYAVGGTDGMYPTVVSAFANTVNAGVTSELHTFSGAPHGFGAGTTAIGAEYRNAAVWPELADVFMQNVYAD